MFLRLNLFVAAVLCGFVACSEDDDFIQRVEQERLEIGSSVETYADLLVCSETRDGDSVEVESEKKIYVCKSGEWNPVAEALNSSSSVNSYLGYSSSLRVVDSAECAQIGRPLTDENTFVDPRDGQKYRMITLGGHTWMAQNLNFETKDSWPATTCSKYGRIYYGYDVIDSAGKYTRDGKACKSFKDCIAKSPIQGICPPGWHLPTKSEMDSLTLEIGNGFYVPNPFIDGYIGDYYGFSAVPTEDYWRTLEYEWWGGEADSLGNELHCLMSNANLDPKSEWNKCTARASNQHPVRCVLDSTLEKPVVPTVHPYRRSKVAACKTMTYDVCEYRTLKDERDGQAYKTVKIFDQWWMTEDLRYNPDDSCNSAMDTVCKKNGQKYSWSFLMDAEGIFSDDAVGCFDTTMCKPSSRVRGICPEGWRVPNIKDWDHLVVNLGGSLDLAITSGIANKNKGIFFDYPFKIAQALVRRGHWSSKDVRTYDAFGFGVYDNFSANKSVYWTSDENSRYQAYLVNFWYGGFFQIKAADKRNEYGVRCIKMDEN